MPTHIETYIMKIKKLLGIAFAFGILVACKKEKPAQEEIKKTLETELITDSIAYSIDGKFHNMTMYSSGTRVGNLQSNAKLDSIIDGYKYYISGDKDSVMYAKSYIFYNDNQRLELVFLKKFNKKTMTNGFLYYPKDIKGFYSVGKRDFVLDYERDNSQNGVAINLIINGHYFKTYGDDSFSKPPMLSADTHKESDFEIVDIKKSISGLYILEAKFKASIYDNQNSSKTINDGYLRINLGLLDETR